jgi:flagellar export protein FliJ
MKARVWEALITKEESRLSVVRQQLDTLRKQRERILERMDYIDSLLTEYANNPTGSLLEISSYQLQLYRMREKLAQEAGQIGVQMQHAELILAKHNNEIRKFDKLRVRTETKWQETMTRKENQRTDESNIMLFNFQRWNED